MSAPSGGIGVAGIYQRLAIAAGRIGPIGKDEQNREQGFSFRSIEAITGRARGVFADLGIGIVPRKIVSISSDVVESRRGTRGYRTVVVVQYSIGCEIDPPAGTGEYPRRDEIIVEMAGEAVDFGDKSTSKATQMAYKYALTEALVIGSEADADGESHELAAPRAPVDPVVALKRWLVDEHGKDLASRAWKILFDSDATEPAAEELTEDRVADIRLAIESIVGDLKDGGEDE